MCLNAQHEKKKSKPKNKPMKGNYVCKDCSTSCKSTYELYIHRANNHPVQRETIGKATERTPDSNSTFHLNLMF